MLCNDNILCLTQTVTMHFNGLFDCSKGHFNRQSLKTELCQVMSHSILYLKGKIGLTLKGGGIEGVSM